MILLFRHLLRYGFVLVGLLACLVCTAAAYTDQAPSSAPFTGGVYVTGTTAELGAVTLYLPVNYQRGYLGLTTSGNLFNASSSSISGVLYRGGSEYQARISAWSTPQYRAQSGSSYYYYDLTFTSIEHSNAEISVDFPPLVAAADVIQYVPILLLGVVVLCLFIKRF